MIKGYKNNQTKIKPYIVENLGIITVKEKK